MQAYSQLILVCIRSFMGMIIIDSSRILESGNVSHPRQSNCNGSSACSYVEVLFSHEYINELFAIACEKVAFFYNSLPLICSLFPASCTNLLHMARTKYSHKAAMWLCLETLTQTNLDKFTCHSKLN